MKTHTPVLLALFAACSWWGPYTLEAREGASSVSADVKLSDSRFLCVTHAGTSWLASLRRAGDTNRVEFIRAGAALGAVRLRVRTAQTPWREVR